GLFSGAGGDRLGERFQLVALVAAAVVAVGALAAALLHHRGHLRPLLRFLAPMAAATRNLRGRHGAEVLVLTVLVWAFEGLVWWLTAEAAGLGIDLVEGLYLLALSSMMVLIPAGPGYAGTLDAAVVIGARALKVGGSAAVTYLLLLRFVLMVPIGIAGLVVAAARYGGVQALLRLRRGA
ncbi:MAG TPA: lysylphosphatidylglycerol synthase domain-containing protein, partial [Solirubrobacteraceae bacterium]|nr:lysylphosphatidylglycerol synthase domain-containing protein [Solirubrobacteraceae bacterium]